MQDFIFGNEDVNETSSTAGQLRIHNVPYYGEESIGSLVMVFLKPKRQLTDDPIEDEAKTKEERQMLWEKEQQISQLKLSLERVMAANSDMQQECDRKTGILKEILACGEAENENTNE